MKKKSRRRSNNDKIEELFRSHVQPRLPDLWDFWEPWKRPWSRMKASLYKEAHLLRHVNESCVDLFEVANTFHAERIRQMVRVVRGNVHFASEALEVSGLEECFERSEQRILSSVRVADLRAEDYEVLQAFGIDRVAARETLRTRSSVDREGRHKRWRLSRTLHWADQELSRTEKLLPRWAEQCHEATRDSELSAKEAKEDALSPICRPRFRTLEYDDEKAGESSVRVTRSESRRGMRMFRAIAELAGGTAASLGDLGAALTAFKEGKLSSQEIATLFASVGMGLGLATQGLDLLRAQGDNEQNAKGAARA